MFNVLTFASLYPSDSQPQNGIFLENRTVQLRDSGMVNVRVVAPVPWFPFEHHLFGRYAAFARTPRHANRSGIDVCYPRYPVIPAVGMSVAPLLMASSLQRTMRRILLNEYRFDLIDSYYMYPDGVAAAMIAKRLQVPFVMTALGTDVNVLPKYLLPRRWIAWAAGRADHITTVSSALKEELVSLEVPAGKITTIRHGVDGDAFRPVNDRSALRLKLNMTRKSLLSVGNLIESKGHHLVVDAMPHLEDAELFIIGQGGQDADLRKRIASHGLGNRVTLVGQLHQHDLAEYYAAADVLVLASSREGIPNVLLESMSCGTPVVATDVGGIAEIVISRDAGILISDRRIGSLVAAITALLNDPPSRDDTVAVARRFSWDATTRAHLAVLSRIVSDRRHENRGGNGAGVAGGPADP